MAKVWTADRNEKLLLLLLEDTTFSYDKLSRMWAQAYPTEAHQPTPRALSEQILKLKKQAKKNNHAQATGAGPTTPKGPSTPRTPSSFRSRGTGSTGKRLKRFDRLALHDDDDDDDSEEDLKPPHKKDPALAVRQTPSRQSKVTAKSYRDYLSLVSDEEDDEYRDIDTLERREGHSTRPPKSLKRKASSEMPSGDVQFGQEKSNMRASTSADPDYSYFENVNEDSQCSNTE